MAAPPPRPPHPRKRSYHHQLRLTPPIMELGLSVSFTAQLCLPFAVLQRPPPALSCPAEISLVSAVSLGVASEGNAHLRVLISSQLPFLLTLLHRCYYPGLGKARRGRASAGLQEPRHWSLLVHGQGSVSQASIFPSVIRWATSHPDRILDGRGRGVRLLYTIQQRD